MDDILTPATRVAERLRIAFSVIDKWGAMWIDEYIDEEDPNDPTKNCVAQWCIGGDFFPAATHDVIQAALAFADKYADDEANIPVTDAESSTPANTRAQSPRSV